MRTLIKNATCVFPDNTSISNVVIEDAKIIDIAASATTTADEVVDASGHYLIPGVIDDQVHFREPGLTHKEDLQTASHACAKGGVTSFFEMPNTKPATITVEKLHEKLAIGAEKSVVNYGFFIGATPDNVEELKKAKRTPGIKIFIGSSTGNLLVDEQSALETIFAETTLTICAHCEDESTVRANTDRLNGGSKYTDHSKIRDHAAALIATKRAIDLAVRHNHRFHVLHVSTADEIPVIAEHPELITAECCPHHLLFNIEDYERLGSLVQMNPSIKTREDCDALWQAMLDGTIEVLATDHAPHTSEEKNQPYPASPSGLPAVENSLSLMLNRVNQGLCTIENVVSWMCSAPARVWDVVNKGSIIEGYDADLVLVDLEQERLIRNEDQLTKCGWTPWHGTTVRGIPTRTWVMGQTVYADGQVQADVRGSEIQFNHK
jgi:dihydroorotase